MTSSALLTREEAHQFLTSVLEIDISSQSSDVTSQGLGLEMLTRIATRIQQRLPFQNLTNMAVQPEHRCIPTPEVIKADMLARRGGLCTSINYFTQQLLAVVGYNATLAAGYVGTAWPPSPAADQALPWTPMPPEPDYNHALVIVRDVQCSGDVFVVETGVGYATFRAVPLDFADESPVYRDSFQPYKYVRMTTVAAMTVDCDGKASKDTFDWFARMHCRREPPTKSVAADAANRLDSPSQATVVGGVPSNTWTQLYCFTPRPVDYSFIADLVNRYIYRNMLTRLSWSVRVICFDGGRAVIVRDRTLFREDDQGHLQADDLGPDDDGLVATILREFPGTFDETLVRQAVAVWTTLSPPASASLTGYP